MKENSEWDLVIGEKKGLLDLRLNQVWLYRDLLWLLVRRDFVAFYKQTILGPIWFFIQPLFTTVTYVFIFSNLAGLSTDGNPPVLFYMVGITVWSYFSDCLIKTANVFQSNSALFNKVYFPRLIMPLSIVLSSLVRLGVQLLLLLVAMTYYTITKHGFGFSWSILLFPCFIFLMAAQGLGIGMIVSALTTKYRDMALLVTFGIQLLMYATPIVYPLSSLQGKMRFLVSLNPMTGVVEGFRYCFLGTGLISLNSILYTVFITFFVLVTGTIIYNKVEKNFVDSI